ncbi:DUF485 domain-containing protein [Sulfurimonas sp. HSL-3221]|uniref:DUF485 domain-containing protein n=1 Tax=Sulfurimonadaceae TaxID=2771471 RepID=UPI001E5952E6|nr:DUF485 domain-containing protein [Sulfurimonas sp. HSL-3221]UFS61893.1 DUF485 domain-containing protein [Sulfurimonas sp. HSL-3221]
MTNEMVEHIKNNPKYQELVKTRSAFAWKLSIVMLVVYFTFILTIAFDPSLLGTPLSETGVTTVGIPVGVAIIFIAFVLTGIYVKRANGEFDDLNREVRAELERDMAKGAE